MQTALLNRLGLSGIAAPILTAGAAFLVALPGPALAFSGESTVRDGCHEHITFLAIENSRWPGDATPPPMTDQDRRLINDVAFTLPESHRNIWSVTVALANREVDLGGHEPDDLPELSSYHADPAIQAEHCLRSTAHDGTQGNIEALAQCRAHIMGEIEAALGPDEEVDLSVRERNPVYLVFRSSIDAYLPRYHYHLGRALHTLQDGFSHQFRDPTNLAQVRHVLNYTDFVGSADYDPARDGFEHISYLDACFDVDDPQERRVLMAAEASAALMDALADGTGGRAGRIARAEEVLVRYLSMDPDLGEMECTPDNAWCGAPEPRLASAWDARQSTCSVAGAGSGRGAAGAAAAAAMLLALGAVLGRRRRRSRGALVIAVGLALGLGLAGAAPAAADDDPEGAADVSTPPAETAAGEEAREERVSAAGAAAESRIEAQVQASGAPEGDPVEPGFGLYAFGRGSVQDAALAAGIGARYDLGSRFTIGLDAEFNPWLDVVSGVQGTSPGTINVYGTAIFKWDVEDYLELRATAHLGISYLLDDLYDAPRGSVGPFVGIAPVGLAFRMGRHVRFVIDPGVMIAIPSMKTVPLARIQYGITLGFQWNP